MGNPPFVYNSVCGCAKAERKKGNSVDDSADISVVGILVLPFILW